MESKIEFINAEIPFFQTPNNIFDLDIIVIAEKKTNKKKGCNETIEVKRKLKPFEKLVYIYLCRCGNNGKRAFPSYNKIAEKCSISRQSAIDAITVLKKNNLIAKKIRKNNKEQYTNEYFVNVLLATSQPSRPGVVYEVDHPSQPSIPKKELYKKNNINIYTLVINHLNQKCGTNFKSTTKKTQQLINARLRDGFVVEDFYTVIDTKVKDWKGQITADGKNMEDYLRPETLFGNKFEGYLNQKTKKVVSNEKANNNAYKEFEFD
ncbi:hypothetical protein CF086_20555 [Clostridium botulinum]|uniref:conserved phage C-terminal domain-containing protein n=2 Tax=Clostridium botulinum TaxID=1491 RepID=UPI0007747A8B|nr:conserved phage C-terminal domain-containing protein [Clostridium botulinum]MBN3352669.1 hypothetical protein [Clostridium botulinum]MBN3368344.1 hypothetical protein [Clostridium botulinum]